MPPPPSISQRFQTHGVAVFYFDFNLTRVMIQTITLSR